MWKRDDSPRPAAPPVPPAPAPATAPIGDTGSRAMGHTERTQVNIGKSVVIKGELSGSEDLTIEGQVDGKIELRQNVLTIGPNGKIKAQVAAKSVVVQGEVVGNITASEKVDIRDSGSVDGDISAPKIAIAEGAHFKGSIDMQRGGAPAAKAPEVKAEPRQAVPAPSAAPAPPAPTGGAPAPTPKP